MKPPPTGMVASMRCGAGVVDEKGEAEEEAEEEEALPSGAGSMTRGHAEEEAPRDEDEISSEIDR